MLHRGKQQSFYTIGLNSVSQLAKHCDSLYNAVSHSRWFNKSKIKNWIEEQKKKKKKTAEKK